MFLNFSSDNISIDFEKGKFYTIIGQSGSGKTTFISLACGLDFPKSGDIKYRGKDLKRLSNILFLES
ncbi:MAG: ATP-binding cassette domain-containing protein [Paraclostridium sp.]